MAEIDKVDLFLRAINESFSTIDVKTTWPLSGAQIDAYFDVDEALDMYYRIKNLRKTKTTKEIAEMLPSADVLRLALQHNLIIGLKVANKLGIASISVQEREEYVNFLFEILESKVHGDIFCLDGKNSLLTKEEIKSILNNSSWNVPKSDDQKKIAFLTVMANTLCHSLYYDEFMTGGFYIHGPYDTFEKFGKGTFLLIRDYHNICPKEIWSDLPYSYKSLRICAIYKDLDLRLNFLNHPMSNQSVPDKLVAYKLYLDNNEISIDKTDELLDLFQKVISLQTKKITSLSPLDKVRKGIEIEYYLFRDFRTSMGDDWKPPISIEKTIETFGDSFLKKFAYKDLNHNPHVNHWIKIFDPRNDYYSET